MPEPNAYTTNLRKVKSSLISSALQKRTDVRARQAIERVTAALTWEPLEELMIEASAWRHVVEELRYDPKLVFCHPAVLLADKTTSLYYRALAGLSIKAAKDYVGAVAT
jgi:hypothetical protein